MTNTAPATHPQLIHRPAPARPIATDYSEIPDELKARPQWVVWKYGKSAKGKKIPKIPFDPRSGTPASTTDPATWGTFEEALTALRAGHPCKGKYGTYRQRYEGPGYVFSPDDPYCGLDWDDCVDVQGTIAPGVQADVTAVDSYTEFSHSKTGVKAIVRATLPDGVHTTRVEMYDRERFFALTGRRIAAAPAAIQAAQDATDRIYQRERPNGRQNRATRPLRTSSADVSGPDLRLDWSFVSWLEQHRYRLMDKDGIPYGATPQLRHLLTEGELPSALAAKGDSPSERRACVASQTQRMQMMPEERYVVLRFLTSKHDWDSKSQQHLDYDFLRMIFLVYPSDGQYHVASLARFRDYRQAPDENPPAPAPQCPSQEKKPRYRPAGREAAQVERLHRMLIDKAEDDVISGDTMSSLADAFNLRYRDTRPISARRMRDYVRIARGEGWLAAGQRDGNGRLIIILKGNERVNCHPKTTESSDVWVTTETLDPPITTRQTMVEPAPCIEGEYTSLCVSPAVPTVADPAPSDNLGTMVHTLPAVPADEPVMEAAQGVALVEVSDLPQPGAAPGETSTTTCPLPLAPLPVRSTLAHPVAAPRKGMAAMRAENTEIAAELAALFAGWEVEDRATTGMGSRSAAAQGEAAEQVEACIGRGRWSLAYSWAMRAPLAQQLVLEAMIRQAQQGAVPGLAPGSAPALALSG